MAFLLLLVSGLSCGIWLFLLLFWGRFWLADQRLLSAETAPRDKELPTVCVVVPARNEATMLPLTLPSLLEQVYPGQYSILLVDDHSTDGTAGIAQTVATQSSKPYRLQILSGKPLPEGWTGKLWAMAQGVAAATNPEYFLFTDADIQHPPTHVQQLIDRAIKENRSLVSEMVYLQCNSFWEKLLIPAFVYFFQLLYPFPWVNTPNHPIAAAAGGCILLKAAYLEKIGGLAAIRNALIDDCALAAAVKKQGGSVWLGLSDTAISLRPYPSLASIWEMVARSAYTQLHYSPWLLMGAVIGLTLTFLVPPVAVFWGTTIGWLGGTTWILMTISYAPTLLFYRQPLWVAPLLPGIALLYLAMTIDSAWRYWQGKGSTWKGRSYSN